MTENLTKEDILLRGMNAMESARTSADSETKPSAFSSPRQQDDFELNMKEMEIFLYSQESVQLNKKI